MQLKFKLCGLLNSTSTSQGLAGIIMLWPSSLTLPGDDLLSTSPRFFYMPLGIQWHGTAIIATVQATMYPPTRDWRKTACQASMLPTRPPGWSFHTAIKYAHYIFSPYTKIIYRFHTISTLMCCKTSIFLTTHKRNIIYDINMIWELYY